MAKKRKQPATQSSTLHDFFGKPTQTPGTRTPASKKPKLKLGPPEPTLSKHKKTSTPFRVAEGDIIVIDDDDEDAFTVVATLSVTFFDAFCIERFKAASPAVFFADAGFTGLISGTGALSTLDSFEVPAPDAIPVETHACESGCLCVAQNFIPHFCIREMNFSCC